MRTLFSVVSLLLAGSACGFCSVDQDLLAMVPSGTKLLTGMDVDRAKASPFGQYFLRRVDSEESHFREFSQQTGFDPRRDLQKVMFAGLGPAGDHAQSRFVILARGIFDDDRIQAAAAAKGSMVQTFQGVRMIVQKGEQQSTAVAFPEIGLAVMGDAATVREIIGQRASPVSLDPELLARVNQIGADSDLWFVSLQPGSFLREHMDTQEAPQFRNAQALQSIRQSSGGMQLGDVVKLSFDAVTRSPQDATSLVDVMRFASSMMQTQRQNDPRAGILGSALDLMQLKADGNSVHASLSLAEKEVERLIAAGEPKRGQ
jgi:hypothetical protein